jgi:hypothetical protein
MWMVLIETIKDERSFYKNKKLVEVANNKS